ncbi:MAG: hypothetical protein IKB13_09435 [Clostridia bacterium]|nr:hypothetical protein [Clostridia bacterium]
MSKKFSRAVSILLAVLLMCGAVIPVFAAEADTIFKPKIAVKVESDAASYGIDDEIVFTITVTNIGRVDAERVYVETKSHKHLDLDDDQMYIVVGSLAAGESKSVELYGRYTDGSNATLLSRLLQRVMMPLQEFIFTMYATVLVPMLSVSNASYCEVNFFDAYEEIDKDYGVLVFAKYGNMPGEAESTTPTTTVPATQPGNDFEEIATDPEVTDNFQEVPDYNN